MGEAARRKRSGDYPNAPSRLVKFGDIPLNTSRETYPTTPSLPLSAHILGFAGHLSESAPKLLPFTDVGEGYISGACHLNVAHRVKHHGGGRVFGWMIWTFNLFTEGEFHSVWRSPNGELIDVTPRKDGEEFVLFVPDPKTTVVRRGAGATLPANRTSSSRFRYTLGGRISEQPLCYAEPNFRTVEHMTKLGMSHYTGDDEKAG